MAPFAASSAAMVTVAAVALLLGMPAGPAMAAKASRPAPWADLFRDVSPRQRATPRRAAAVPLPKPRPAEAPVGRARQAGQGAAGVSAERQARPAGCARTAAHATAVGLPAGADGRHRDCAQHPRHQGRRRLRRRGSGAAGGDRAAGQAAGFGEAGGDPALYHGVCAGRVDPQRYRAAGGAPRQHRLRSRQFRLVRVPRPQPHRRRQALRARPRQCARRSRLQARQRHARSR